jgi:hypothetical protein
MAEETPNQFNTPTIPTRIVSHEFSGDKCKVLVEGTTMAELQSSATKKAVYEYRHTIGASHMGLNKFEPTLDGGAFTKEGSPIRQGFWYLMAGL